SERSRHEGPAGDQLRRKAKGPFWLSPRRLPRECLRGRPPQQRWRKRLQQRTVLPAREGPRSHPPRRRMRDQAQRTRNRRGGREPRKLRVESRAGWHTRRVAAAPRTGEILSPSDWV